MVSVSVDVSGWGMGDVVLVGRLWGVGKRCGNLARVNIWFRDWM